MNRLMLGLRAARQLGLGPVGLNAAYRLGQRTGLWRRLTPVESIYPLRPDMGRLPLELPDPDHLRAVLGADLDGLFTEADEIVRGEVRLFGGPAVALDLTPPNRELHWQAAEARYPGDIKWAWEPARFGWAYRLAQAHRLSGDQRYVIAFLFYFRQFLEANPPNRGPNWASGQEVALRLMALAFAAHSLPLEDDIRAQVAGAIWAHARRIPPTLLYARSQQNNHLLTEAAGLLTAGALFAHLPEGQGWLRLGWRWLNRGLQAQLGPDGGYAQHSLTYHRLMLQAALWSDGLRRGLGWDWPDATRQRLSAAARWLAAQVDPVSGDAPNWGHNDGADILPLGEGGFRDFRATAQAAMRAFCGRPALPAGAWDALSLWLGQPLAGEPEAGWVESPGALRLGAAGRWGSLRVVRYTSRPGQADPLQVELWDRGINLLRDPGTFAYNAEPPWDNGLAGAAAHNGVQVDGQEPMTRAGRFLWLDWAQAQVIPGESQAGRRWTAEHSGYDRLGVRVRRTLEQLDLDEWQVTDRLLPAGAEAGEHSATIQWLLPDGEWTELENGLQVQVGGRVVTLAVQAEGVTRVQVARAGEVLAGGSEVPAIAGWFSPTYGVREPGLSLRVSLRGRLPLEIVTRVSLAEPPSDLRSPRG